MQSKGFTASYVQVGFYTKIENHPVGLLVYLMLLMFKGLLFFFSYLVSFDVVCVIKAFKSSRGSSDSITVSPPNLTPLAVELHH
jgi:hypothetical protein